MHIHTNLFVGDGLKKPESMIKKLKKKKLPPKFYFAAFEEGSDRLEIYLSYLFIQKYFKNRELEIVGIFKSEEDAFEYVRALSEISVRKYGDFCAKKTIDSLSGFELEMLKRKNED